MVKESLVHEGFIGGTAVPRIGNARKEQSLPVIIPVDQGFTPLCGRFLARCDMH
jgi:hypothetical protein